MLTRISGICCFLSAVLYTAFVRGEENTCTVQSRGNRSYKIIWTISSAAFKEGQSFNLFTHTNDKKERVAVLNYVGFYLCHAFEGYLCQTLSPRTFIITPSSCEKEFVFSADGEQPERCTNTTCTDYTTQHRSKNEASDDECPEGEYSNMPMNDDIQNSASNTNSNKEGEMDREEDVQTQEASSLAIGLSTGCLLTVMITVSVVFFHRRYYLKHNNRNGTDVELQKSTENTNDHLLLKKSNGNPITSEDKERNSFLMNKETSDYI